MKKTVRLSAETFDLTEFLFTSKLCLRKLPDDQTEKVANPVEKVPTLNFHLFDSLMDFKGISFSGTSKWADLMNYFCWFTLEMAYLMIFQTV